MSFQGSTWEFGEGTSLQNLFKNKDAPAVGRENCMRFDVIPFSVSSVFSSELNSHIKNKPRQTFLQLYSQLPS